MTKKIMYFLNIFRIYLQIQFFFDIFAVIFDRKAYEGNRKHHATNPACY